MSIIEFQQIFKQYDEKTVLQNINLQIEAGEFITIVGRSGCGKTTLLRLVNGLEQPSSGQVLIRQQDLFALNEQEQGKMRRTIGYVIQETGLFPHLKIRDNIGYVLSLEKTAKTVIAERVQALMEIVQLEPHLADRYPHQLSGGQRQRVGIARALAANPDIILMDEPFGAVDEITRESLQQELKRIQQQLHTTIVFVTHDISEALLLGSRVLVLHRGNIAQFATPETIVNQPANAFVSQLFGKRLLS